MSLKKIITLDNLQSFYNKLPSWSKNSTKPSYSYSEIENTPSLGTAASKDVAPGGGNADNTQVVMGNDSRLTNSRNPTAHASDLVTSLTGYSTAKAATSAIPISDSDSLNTAMGKLEKDSELNQTNILSVEDMICDTEFSTSTAYAVGDIVTYEHGLYEFTSAHSAGAWNSADVTQIDVVGIIGDINTVLEGVL